MGIRVLSCWSGFGGSGARILRTDEEGAVQVVTDGHSLRVNCFMGCRVEAAVSGNVKAPDHDKNQ